MSIGASGYSMAEPCSSIGYLAELRDSHLRSDTSLRKVIGASVRCCPLGSYFHLLGSAVTS